MQDSFNAISDSSGSTISLREYGDVLRRRRAIILQTFVVVLVAGVLVTIFQTQIYRSTARLLLEAPSYVINQVSSDPLADLFRVNNEYSIGTQVELLQSEKIRKEVAQNLGSASQPASLPNMTVSGIDNTSIIEVVSEGPDPEMVANAPNELLRLYVDEAAGSSTAQLESAIKYAQKNSDEAFQKLNAAEQALRDYKTRNNIEDLEKNRDSQIKNVEELSGQYAAIQTELRVLQAKIDATKKQMTAAGKSHVMVVSIEADQAIQGVDASLSNLDVQRAALEQTDRPGMTIRFQQLDAQRAELLKRKSELVKKFNLRNAVVNPQYQAFADQLLGYNIDSAVLAERAVSLGGQLSSARARLSSFPTFEQQTASLIRKFDDAKSRFALFSSKLSDLELRYQTRRPMAQVMQKADVPSVPVRPKKVQNIILSGVLGLFFGLCLALLQELFDDRINTPEEAERVLHMPTLGLIPMIEEEGLRLIRDISTFSPLMEAYRTLRTNINFAAVGTPIRSLVVTSSVPAEGKSTTVANLAMAMALDNKRVIVVDADLRRPSLHKLFKIDSSPGLTDILVGTHEVDETIRDSGVPGVSVIPAGSPPPNPAELLGSAAMGALLAQLEGKADIVLFDSPPSLAVADGVVLASRANGVVLVVGYGETKKASTKKALEILARANASVLGTVLNRMDGTGSGYYYGKYYVPAADRAVGTTASIASSAKSLPQAEPDRVSGSDDTGA